MTISELARLLRKPRGTIRKWLDRDLLPNGFAEPFQGKYRLAALLIPGQQPLDFCPPRSVAYWSKLFNESWHTTLGGLQDYAEEGRAVCIGRTWKRGEWKGGEWMLQNYLVNLRRS